MEAIRRAALLLSLALGVPPAVAAMPAPDALLSAVTSEVVAILDEDRKQPQTAARLAEAIETKVLPLFNFPHMTRLVMARNWRLASPEQQRALTAEFTILLVRTYAAALLDYRGEVLEFKPLRAEPGAAVVTVKCDMNQGRDRMVIDYDMHRTPAGWKIYDVKIDGTSFVTVYRESFASQVRAAGVDGLIQALVEKNRRDDSAPRPASVSEARARFIDGLVRSVLRAGG
jgi:phospholipid transport system substrate-binding protein